MSTIQDKSRAFAIRVINCYRYLTEEKNEFVISKQILRSGTSIGANNAEATNAVSKADYRSKSYIALKEARESLYWIELMHRNDYLDDKQYQSIYADCEELVKILVSRCKKLDEQLNVEKK